MVFDLLVEMAHQVGLAQPFLRLNEEFGNPSGEHAFPHLEIDVEDFPSLLHLPFEERPPRGEGAGQLYGEKRFPDLRLAVKKNLVS